MTAENCPCQGYLIPGRPALGSWYQSLPQPNQVAGFSSFTFSKFSSDCRNGSNKSMGMEKSVLDLLF
jgi:hypothetical protein